MLALLLSQPDFTNASPFGRISQGYNEINCGSSAAAFDSACWTRLGLSQYLVDTETGWYATTPVCLDSTQCCLSDEPWSTCFLRLGRELGGADCTTMDDSKCTWDNEVGKNLSESIEAEVRYVMASIYGVHEFFSSYFKGKRDPRLCPLLSHGSPVVSKLSNTQPLKRH